MFSTNLFENAHKLGVTPVVAMRMEKEFDRMYAEAREESFLVTMALMYNALIMDFWKKTGKKKIFELHKSFLSLYDAYLCGAITLEDLGAYIKEETGDEIRTGNIKLTGEGKWEKVADMFSYKMNYKVRHNESIRMLKKAVADMEKIGAEKTDAYEEIKRYLKEEEELDQQSKMSF